MFKNFMIMAVAATLSACSGSSSNSGTDDSGTPPASGTKAGAYIGDFGSGNGVYVINNANALAGLALAANGTANSLFGNLGAGSAFNGTLRSYFHTSSDPAEQGIFSAGEPGANAPTPAPTSFNLNIVNGQTIESLSGASVSLVGASAGSLSPATASTLGSGTWSGRHRYCDQNLANCNVLVTEVTFAANAVTGRTYIETSTGAEQFENAIAGSTTDFGDVSVLTFTWNGNTYNGAVFFLPGSSTQLVFLGETTAAEAGNKTIASLLTR